MRIHSNPTVKMIQQAGVAAAGDTPAPSECSPTMPHSGFPREDDLPSEASRGSDRDEEESDEEDLDYRESWDLLFSGILEDHCRLARKGGCGRDPDAPSPAPPHPGKRRQGDQPRGARARRVRRYKKWVSLRLGSFDWSFALFFVVKSRSSSRSCNGGSDPGAAESTAPLSAT